MYALNPLNQRVLISPAEVLANIPNDGALAERTIVQAILIAETRFVRPLLGGPLYDELRFVKNVTVGITNKNALQVYIDEQLQGNQTYELKDGDFVNAMEFMDQYQRNLWHEYLCKFIAECVRFVAMPEIYVQFTNSGMMKNNPTSSIMPDSRSESVGAGLSDMKWLMDKQMSDRIEVLQRGLHDYLCENKPYFTKYIGDCPCKDKATPQRGGWISIYEDDDIEPCPCDETVPEVPAYQPRANFLRKQFNTIAGQTQYPYVGQPNELTILEEMKGMTLTSLTLEGVDIFVGDGEDEMVGIDPGTGRITWNTPAFADDLRMIAILQRG